MTVSEYMGQIFSAYPEYDSDESAILDGLASGDTYLTSDNHVSIAGGILRRIP